MHTTKFEINIKCIDNSKQFTSEAIANNIFIAVDDALKKLMNAMGQV